HARLAIGFLGINEQNQSSQVDALEAGVFHRARDTFHIRLLDKQIDILGRARSRGVTLRDPDGNGISTDDGVPHACRRQCRSRPAKSLLSPFNGHDVVSKRGRLAHIAFYGRAQRAAMTCTSVDAVNRPASGPVSNSNVTCNVPTGWFGGTRTEA